VSDGTMTVNDELKRIGKKSVVAYVNLLSKVFCGGILRERNSNQDGR
jgi:hypothetical protein